MAQPERILVARGREARREMPPLPGAPEKAWAAIGWFGLLLAIVGFGDLALLWFPFRLGNPEWEFGTIAATLAGLPLPTMGMAFLLAAGLGLGRRWLIRATSWSLLVLALLILAAYVVFLTNVPMALKGTPEAIALGVKRAVVKTTLLGLGFPAAYMLLAIGTLKHAGGRIRRRRDAQGKVPTPHSGER
jgi:hypothetical protein